MTEFIALLRDFAPVYLPLGAAIVTIVFTKQYVYKGMIPESMLAAQVEREKSLLADSIARERTIVEGAKDIQNQLVEIVRQLESLTKKVSEEIRANTERLSSVEHCVSDLIDQYNALNYNFEMHRKGIPPTETFLQERKK